MEGLTNEYIESVLKHFRGREDTFAIQPAGGHFRPQPLKDPLSVKDFREQHLSGKNCLGIYVLDSDSNVWMSCVDFDSHADNPDPQWIEKTESVYYFLVEQGLSPCVEVSASGIGSHVWLLFDEPVEAWLPRAFFTGVSNFLEIPMPEIYPRQDRLVGKGLGNLIRMPYFDKSRFVDVESDWDAITPEFKTTDVAEMKMVASKLRIRMKPLTIKRDADELHPIIKKILVNRPTGLLSRRWNCDTDGLKDPSKSACVMSLVISLLDEYMQPDHIDEAIIQWGNKHGYEKAVRREDFRLNVIEKAYELKQNPKRINQPETGNFLECAIASLNRNKADNYIKFGIESVDKSIDGVAKGEMALIMARPGHGKSAIGAQWLENAAKTGHPALMLNAEMSALEQGRRNLMKITGSCSEEDWLENKQKYLKMVEEYYTGWSPPHFRSVSSIEDVEREVRAYKTGYEIEAVVVDYVQLLRSRGISRYEQVSDISIRLKCLARDEDIAMIALCQASREVEKRNDVEFLPSDLKESGQLEQDADLVGGLYWWGRSRGSGNPNCADLCLIKRRNGPIRNPKVRMLFNASRQHFSEWTE